MKKLINFIFISFLLTGCSGLWPDVAKTLDDIETDNAIRIEINKAAILKETDIKINIEVIKKD